MGSCTYTRGDVFEMNAFENVLVVQMVTKQGDISTEYNATFDNVKMKGVV